MSWAAHRPPERPVKPSKAAPPAVTISVARAKRYAGRAYVTLRPALLHGALAWWANSAPVSVEVGEDEHAGRMRITAGGPWAIMPPTGKLAAKGQPNPPSLQIPALPGMPAEGLARRAVDWEIVEDALVVTLPWGGAKGAVKLAPRPPAKLPTARDEPPTPPVIAPPPEPAATPALVTPQSPVATLARKAAVPAAPVRARSPQFASYGEIEQWAIANAVGSATHGFDLGKVNALRVKQGHRPFLIRRTVRA